MNRSILPLVLILTCGLLQPAFASSYGLAYDSQKWEKHSLVVCWGDFNDLAPTNQISEKLLKDMSVMQPKSASNILKNKIQSKVQEQYTLEKTGIEFIGWKPCQKTVKTDIVLAALENTNSMIGNKLDELPYGAADIGKPPSPEIKRYVFIRASLSPSVPSPDAYIIQTAVHEFGHVTALRHEHQQVEAIEDKNCSALRIEMIKEDLRNNGTDGNSYGAYDPQSIMNDCYLDIFEKKILDEYQVKLSAGDLHTLSCLYKPESEPDGSCVAKNPTPYPEPDGH